MSVWEPVRTTAGQSSALFRELRSWVRRGGAESFSSSLCLAFFPATLLEENDPNLDQWANTTKPPQALGGLRENTVHLLCQNLNHEAYRGQTNGEGSKQTDWGKEHGPMGKELAARHEDPTSIPHTHIKNSGYVACASNSITRSWKQEDHSQSVNPGSARDPSWLKK